MDTLANQVILLPCTCTLFPAPMYTNTCKQHKAQACAHAQAHTHTHTAHLGIVLIPIASLVIGIVAVVLVVLLVGILVVPACMTSTSVAVMHNPLPNTVISVFKVCEAQPTTKYCNKGFFKFVMHSSLPNTVASAFSCLLEARRWIQYTQLAYLSTGV